MLKRRIITNDSANSITIVRIIEKTIPLFTILHIDDMNSDFFRFELRNDPLVCIYSNFQRI